MKLLITLIIFSIITSCSELHPSNGRFVIKEAVQMRKGISKYWATPLKGFGNIFFYDSAHKYFVGDIIYFTKEK